MVAVPPDGLEAIATYMQQREVRGIVKTVPRIKSWICLVVRASCRAEDDPPPLSLNVENWTGLLCL